MKRNRTNNSDVEEESYSLDMSPPGSKESKKDSHVSDGNEYWAGIQQSNKKSENESDKKEHEYETLSSLASKYSRINDLVDDPLYDEIWEDKIGRHFKKEYKYTPEEMAAKVKSISYSNYPNFRIIDIIDRDVFHTTWKDRSFTKSEIQEPKSKV